MVASRSMRPSRQLGLQVSKTLFNYQPPVACKRAWQKRRGERKISQKDPCRKLSEREGVQKENFSFAEFFGPRRIAAGIGSWLGIRSTQAQWARRRVSFHQAEKSCTVAELCSHFPSLRCLVQLSALHACNRYGAKQGSAMPLNEKDWLRRLEWNQERG